MDDIEQRLVLPDKSTTSSTLNGMGNGMMLMGIPLVLAESCFPLFNKTVPNYVRIGSLVAIAAGAVFGGMYGKREGDEINKYRSALRSEMTNLHKKIHAHIEPTQNWADGLKSDSTEISR